VVAQVVVLVAIQHLLVAQA